MRATGIVRRVDDLGRIVIPREIRRSCHIREGDALEISIDPVESCICLKRYEPYSEPWRLLEDAAEAMRGTEDFSEFVTDVEALAKKIKKSTQDE